MVDLAPFADDDAWVIPLHGIVAPPTDVPAPRPASPDVAALHLYTDDELPTIEFRPQLRRTA